jgi:hypothetical protein
MTDRLHLEAFLTAIDASPGALEHPNCRVWIGDIFVPACGCPHFTDARLAPGSGYPESTECGYPQGFSSYYPCLAGQGVAFSPVVDRLSRFLMISAPGHFHLLSNHRQARPCPIRLSRLSALRHRHCAALEEG